MNNIKKLINLFNGSLFKRLLHWHLTLLQVVRLVGAADDVGVHDLIVLLNGDL